MSDSYACGERVPALLEETIGANLDRIVQRFGERDALVSCAQGIRYTYAELGAAVDELARALLDAGLEPGDRLGIWSPNCAEWTVTQYASAKIGAILVNVNPAYRTSELQYALAQSGCRMLIAAPAFKAADYRAMLAEVCDRLPALERVVFLHGPDWDELLAGAASVGEARLRAVSEGLRPADSINIQYTSGTTGHPKGATLTHRNILNNGFFVGEGCRYTAEDRICIPVPFYHCFGMVMGNLGATTHGCAMVIPAPAFDPEATLRACADERCTSLSEFPRCSSANWTIRGLPSSTSPRCAPGSWPARPARWRS